MTETSQGNKVSILNIYQTWPIFETCFILHFCNNMGEISENHAFVICYREKAETALWFAETYGLTPKSLSLEDTTGPLINVTFKGQEFNQGNYHYVGCNDHEGPVVWR